MTNSKDQWTDSSEKPNGYHDATGQIIFLKLLTAVILLLFCMMPLTVHGAAPEVAIIDGPEEGAEIQQGKTVGFTFTAAGGGSEIMPGNGPLIILAAGDANPNINSHWLATENMVKIVYNGFVNAMGYTHDDIFLIMGKSVIDIDDDGTEDPGIIDHSKMTKSAVTAAMDGFARQNYKKGQTLYLWVIGHGGGVREHCPF